MTAKILSSSYCFGVSGIVEMPSDNPEPGTLKSKVEPC